jgi:3-oxoacyl-[acyl-carrier protein] reductase
MDLKIGDSNFIVCGAGSGFGKAISTMLVKEGAHVWAISRTESKLMEMKKELGDNFHFLKGDVTDNNTQDKLLKILSDRVIHGVVINAGGPPAGSVDDLDMNMWDDAWQNIVRWKISFVYKLLPILRKQEYGRLVFIESVSVKEPVPNLVLSNSLRPAVVGFAKSLSREIASEGINVNILAPGYHATDAMKRLIVKRSEIEGITLEEAKYNFEKEIPVGEMGLPEEMASIACWLLSPLSRYVTGQTITHDGGLVRHVFG